MFNGEDMENQLDVVRKTGRITVVLPDDLDRRLRVEVAKRGGKKGDLSVAINEAVELWLKEKK